MVVAGDILSGDYDGMEEFVSTLEALVSDHTVVVVCQTIRYPAREAEFKHRLEQSFVLTEAAAEQLEPVYGNAAVYTLRKTNSG